MRLSIPSIVTMALSVILAGAAPVVALTQDLGPTQSSAAKTDEIPQYVRAEAVMQVLRSEFEGTTEDRTVHLVADDLSPGWLPQIPHVTFQVHPTSEREALVCEKQAYWYFEDIQRSGDGYRISLVRNDDCIEIGGISYLIWADGALILKRTNEATMATACGCRRLCR